MTNSAPDSEIDLVVLARRLSLEGMPAQTVVAAEAHVSQPTVSRAMRCQIKTVTKSVRRLWKYTEDRLSILEAAPQPVRDDPLHPISHSQPPETSGTRSRSRASPLPRRRTSTLEQDSPESREVLAKVALDGLKDYLEDRFDPLLVIEQLAVLRRAQDHARRRGADD